MSSNVPILKRPRVDGGPNGSENGNNSGKPSNSKRRESMAEEEATGRPSIGTNVNGNNGNNNNSKTPSAEGRPGLALGSNSPPARGKPGLRLALGSNSPAVGKPALGFVVEEGPSPAVENSPAPAGAAAFNRQIRMLHKDYMTDEFKEKYYPVGKPPKGINAILNESTRVENNKAENNKIFKYKGAASSANLYKFPKNGNANGGDMYIVRRTKRERPETYYRIANEIDIYKKLQHNLPEARKYISELVYADAYVSGGRPESRITNNEGHQYSYFVFKYEPGERLDDFIKRHEGTMTAAQVLDIYNHLLAGIHFMELNRVVHRDLKPDNIWFSTERNIPLIFDFSTACIMKGSNEGGFDRCSSSEFVGTREYASPGANQLKSGVRGFFNISGTYNYTPTYDKYAALLILQKDLIKLVKPDEKGVIGDTITKDKAILDPENASKFRKAGGSCSTGTCFIGGNRKKGGQRIGIMNPTWGGFRITKKRKVTKKIGGGGCGCGGAPKPMMALPTGFSLGPLTAGLKGGGCPCNELPKLPTPLSGGYKATKRNLKYLKLWKKGKSIGFTMRSSLKAKGLIPRANGTKRVSAKYRR